ADTPLPPLPDAARAALPDLPLLVPGTPHFLDLEREPQATFKRAVAEAGLYELATTGLLATAASVRTRTNPDLAQASESGGVGRNATLRPYLRGGGQQLAGKT